MPLSRPRRGFSYVELSIAIAILAGLTFLAGGRNPEIRDRAVRARAHSDLETLRLAIQRHILDHEGRLPSSEKELVPYLTRYPGRDPLRFEAGGLAARIVYDPAGGLRLVDEAGRPVPGLSQGRPYASRAQ